MPDHSTDVASRDAVLRALSDLTDRERAVIVLRFYEDLGENEIYQLTDFYTGAQGIVPLAPILSWASQADRLAFVYFEKSKYDIYSITNPRALRRRPYQRQLVDSVGMLARVVNPPLDTTRTLQVRDEVKSQVGEGGSIYRTPSGFRSSTASARVSAGTTVTSQPAVRSWRRMLSLMPASYAMTEKRAGGGVT